MDTIHPETITFKILSTFPGGMTHLSPLVTTTVSCGDQYAITEVSAPTNPQFVQHDGAVYGFTLPTFQSSQNVGCPPSQWEVSTSDSEVVANAGLNTPQDIDTDKKVTPVDSSLHQAYSFYLKVTADGGSVAFFGPYVVNVGCFEGAVVLADSPSLLIDH